jgi:hypothetical protein
VGRDVLWWKTARLAYRLFYYQRCGTAVPGFHGPCHLDDAKNLAGTRWYNVAGGWHDAGDYNTNYQAPHVYGLATAYGLEKARFDRLDQGYPQPTRFPQEIAWGADQVRRMVLPDGSVPGPLSIGVSYMGAPEIETDNIPRTGDERPVLMDDGQDPSTYVAALAKCARYVQPADKGLLAAAERGIRWCMAKGTANAEVLDAALDLYAVTRKPQYRELARRLFPKVGMDDAEVAAAYDAQMGENHREAIRSRLAERADALLALSGDNPFGVYRFGPKERPSYFLPPPPDGAEGSPGGTFTEILPAARLVAQAYRYALDPRYLAYVYDQLDWMLGVNPLGLCMLEGAGSFNPPRYHQALTFGFPGRERGEVPGGIPNGYTWRGPADDRPWFDMRLIDIPDSRTSETWLPHNKDYLLLVTALMRARGLQ